MIERIGPGKRINNIRFETLLDRLILMRNNRRNGNNRLTLAGRNGQLGSRDGRNGCPGHDPLWRR